MSLKYTPASAGQDSVLRLRAQARSAKPESRCVVVTEAGSYLRIIDFCITQLKAQGPYRTCNESKTEEEGDTKVYAP